MVSQQCSSITPNMVLLKEEVEGGGGKRRICQSMSDPPNPQVRRELYDGRLSQARRSKTQYTYERLTLESNSHMN